MSHRHSSGPGTAMAARMLNIGLSMCLQEGAGEAGGRREHLGQGVPSKVICKVTCKVPVERQVLGFPLKGAVPSAQDTEEMLNFLAG